MDGGRMIGRSAPWCTPPVSLALGVDEVHVWRASLNVTAVKVQSLRETLAADEAKRGDCYYFQEDREHFIVARGLLRAIIGLYVNREPWQLRFWYGLHGKPELTRDASEAMVRFNLSHSHGLALYAVTRDREIGIDLEWICSGLDDEKIAQRYFSRRELAVLHSLPAQMQKESFFACWTRKEAYIKARGAGLSIPLDQFEVSLAPGELAALLSGTCGPQGASRWSLQDLAPGPGYVAALAVEGHDWRLQCWQWPE